MNAFNNYEDESEYESEYDSEVEYDDESEYESEEEDDRPVHISGFIRSGIETDEIHYYQKEIILDTLRMRFYDKRILELESEKEWKRLFTNLIEEFSYHPLCISNQLTELGDWKLIKTN